MVSSSSAPATPVDPDVTTSTRDAFVVRGGRTLSGTVRVSGAKNSALKLFAAALMAPGRTVLTNVPGISDIGAMADVVRHLGVEVTVQPARWSDTVVLDVPKTLGRGTTHELAGRLRASLVVMGPLAARTGYAYVAQPGGCDLGNRGIDLHLDGMRALGAEVTVGPDSIEVHAPDGLTGVEHHLEYASVGATENLVMAATLARGTTVLRNVAREPEISDLVTMLRAMGADITGEGSPDLVINGVQALTPCTHAVVGDRIEAGTFAVAAAITGGDVTIQGVDPDHLRIPLARLQAAGVQLRTGADHIRVLPGARLVAADIATLPFPGFPTDLLAIYEVLLSQATGRSILTENVYDGRFGLLEELGRMGVEATLEGHHILIDGPSPLHGAVVTSTDLRAGAALVLAGLVADGQTVVCDPYHVDRGYTDLLGKLRQLGADIDRVPDLDTDRVPDLALDTVPDLALDTVPDLAAEELAG